MELDVLGPVRVRRDGLDVDLGTPRQRAIVAALALGEGRVVPVDTVVDRVWGTDPPATVTGTLQSYVGGLRRALEPGRRPREAASVLVTEHGGYALRVPLAGRDDVALAEATARARELLRVVPDPLRPTVDATGAGACREALDLLDAALDRWRGTPYADLADDDAVTAERSRLADLRTAADELGVVARLALGDHAAVVPRLEAMTRAHPLHERWWALHAVALVRAGRQADALAALQRLRSVLDDELGVEPSAAVRDLQTAILRQDPDVTGGPPTTAPAAVAPSAPVAGAPGPPTRFRVSPPLPQYALAGREPELARLRLVLDAAASGRSGAAWVTGEAGIGKSRLVHELALEAFARGFTVVTGDCGHTGAPELWPWRQVVTSLEQQRGPLPEPVTGLFEVGLADEFATWEGLASALRTAARRDPLLVVLEDVHDADAPTLRLLQHLVATAAGERLLVVVTRRAGAGDDAVLVPLAAALARRDGVRVDLGGLDEPAASSLVAQATGVPPDSAHVAALRERTAGNPFFLVELARAGDAGGSLADVVGSRLADLPPPARAVLEAAAIIDVRWDEDLVAFMLDLEPADVAAQVTPAVAAGLVVEDDPAGRVFRFTHAVVRDVVRDGLPATVRNGLHARVATVLDERSGLRRVVQRTELARHWALAGKAHAARAWPSVLRAAAQATADSAHVEAMRLIEDARDLQRLDLAAGDRARYELLMLLVDAQRWAGRWEGVAASVDEAVAAAERLGDHELAARAAMSTIEGAVWQVRTWGVVHAPIVAALERAVVRLDEDGAAVGLRARARVALATELYYGGDVERVDALVDEGLGLAESADDLRLLSVVLTGAFSARWRPDTLAWRRAAAERAVTVAVELGDARAQAVALGLRACAALEAGEADMLRDALPAALSLARRLGLVTLEAVLLAAEVPWRLLEGDDATAGTALALLDELAAASGVPNLDRAAAGTAVLAALWQGDAATLEALLRALAEQDDDGLQMGHLASWVLLRVGQTELARAVYPVSGVDLREGSYTTLANACLACELGHGLGDPDLAARGYAVAAPYAGRMASGGSAMAIGPVDGFLAVAALALGDGAAAHRHATAARALGESWGLTRFVTWFDAAWTRALTP
ncbi:hypothetical protein GCM10023340_02690 [Nocardioides marinquilinus]|uniref:OmpR/PhoB-type domain-containing protein n=1 Tax=Nocardioides marinquilinus TaxID=1210400 RepID=A0ABP9P6D1_9ACTN